MLQYEVKVDKKEFDRKTRKLIEKTPKLNRLILGRLSEAVISESVRNYLSGQALHRRTGTLVKSLNHRLLNDWTAEIGTNVRYAAIHEFGGVIRPKTANFLKFQVEDGSWVYTKKVTMPQRPYLAPALQKVFSSGLSQRIMNRAVNEYLVDRVWER